MDKPIFRIAPGFASLAGKLLIACLFCMACNQSETIENSQFRLVPSTESNIDFVNSVESSKSFNIFSYRNFYNGGGVAIGDVNNDGLQDIYFTHNTKSNRLYLNRGDLQFEDVTEKAGVGGTRGWSTGVVMVDINHDRLLDIYVCNAGYVRGDDQENELFINQGDGTFKEEAEAYGLNESGYTTHAAFFDYDQDGDLDVYILNNSFIPVNTLNYSNQRELKAENWPVKDFLKGGGDKLLRNDEGKFTDVTDEAGIYSSLIGFGLGVTVGDINGDYLPDIYISNDFFERDYLYLNQGDGTFSEEIKDWMQHISLSSMGADMADINNDGYPEIFVTDMLPGDEYRLRTMSSFENYSVYELKLSRDFYHQYMHNTLQLNNQNRTFSEISYYSGVAASDWSWGALMFDMDNDGKRDIYVCNGIYHDVTDQDFIDFFADEVIQKMTLTGKKEDVDSIIAQMPSVPVANKAFRNGENLKFEDVTRAWGFDIPSFSNGAAYADLDLDGDLDLVTNNLFREAFLFENQSNAYADFHYLKVSLVGQEPNTFAIGSKLTLHCGEEIRSAEIIPSRGFQSSIAYPVHFGLSGMAQPADSLVITWPDLRKYVITKPPMDTTLQISYAGALMDLATPKATRNILAGDLFEQVPAPVFKAHREDPFVDFYAEGLIAKKLSNEGPAFVSGDMNGDGIPDLFMGAAAGDTAMIYFGSAEGFELAMQEAFVKNADFEDVAAKLLDIDGDADLDLIVGSGGNHTHAGSRQMQDRVYINDGSGTFTLNPKALPNNGFNTAVIVYHDLDGDGDEDLFVGSRSVPLNYGVAPRSYIYINDGQGLFADRTKEIAPGLEFAGMITDAHFVELYPDLPGIELVVIGEWMEPQVYSMQNGQLQQMETNLEPLAGWWNSIASADLDGDGKLDLVLGNRGENFYFDGTPENPAKLWVADFDQNGTVENIITRHIGGKDIPVPMKRELLSQLVSLKKENITHREFAQKSIQELMPSEMIKKARVLEGARSSSIIALNRGKGNFEVRELPPEVQFSCVCDIYCEDLNNDDIPDMLMVGNDFGFAPQFSRLDASFGHVLLNDGKGNFQSIRQSRKGFYVPEQGKKILPFKIGGKPHLVVAVNNDRPKLFKLK